MKKEQTDEEFFKTRLAGNIKNIHSVTRIKQLLIITEKMMMRECMSESENVKGWYQKIYTPTRMYHVPGKHEPGREMKLYARSVCVMGVGRI